MKKTTGAAVGAMSFPYIVSSSALDRVNKYKSSVATEANQPPRPNVVFILTDDQSYSTMSCTGSSFMKTPNLDRLARDGALFRNLILATSVCSPSRAAFMTGTYNWVNGVFANAAKWNPKNVILAQMMQKAGYATAHIGKWHCGDLKDPQPGYDHWFVAPGQGRYEDPIINVNGRNRTFQGEYLTTLTTDETIRFISQDHGGKPFLVWYGMKAVHGGRGSFNPVPKLELGNVPFKGEKMNKLCFAILFLSLSPRKTSSALSLQHLRELATCDQLYYLGRLNAIRNLLTNLCSVLGGACETL